MNWRKRKKLNKLAKKHGLIHGYEYKRFIRKTVIKIRYKNRNGRRYSPEFLSAAVSDFKKHRDQLIKEGKWRGEINHPSDRLPDDVRLEKLEWIIPPIPVTPNDYVPEVNLEELEKLANECRKERDTGGNEK